MRSETIACARCGSGNHPSCRFCELCSLPLGAAQADADAVLDILGVYDYPDPDESVLAERLGAFARRSGFESAPYGPGWRLIVPLPEDRRQAVYVGPAGEDPEGRSLAAVVSVCGAANDRDTRTLLKLNARRVEGHFAIRVLRGEEYFVVLQMVPEDQIERTEAAGLVGRIARAADGLEDRLTRGLDVF